MFMLEEGKGFIVLRKALRVSSLVVFASILSGCTQPGDPIYEAYELAEVGDRVDFAINIQPIFEKSCSPCHLGGGGSAGVFLDDYEVTMASGTVEPCEPDQSSLYLVLQDSPPGGMLKMPLGGELSGEEIETIRIWISQGAAPDSASSEFCGDSVVSGDVASSDSKE